MNISPKGGRSPAICSEKNPHRDALWEQMSSMGEGEIFKPETLLQDFPSEAKKDFLYMDGHDHVPIGQGWHVAIKESPFNRLLPDPIKVVQSWSLKHSYGAPLLFGDWDAWKMKLYPWEPFAGYRFRLPHYTGNEQTLLLGHMRLRLHSPGAMTWLSQDEPEYELPRALYDIPHKTLRDHLKRWIIADHSRLAKLKAAIDFLHEQDESWHNTSVHIRQEQPSVVATLVKEALP